MIFKLLLLSLTISACTYNVSLNHSEGTATGVNDDNTTPTTEISPTISPTIEMPKPL